MIRELLKLANWLRKNAQEEEAKKIEDLSQYEEPWHEEAVKEFGEEPISEEEYLKKNFPVVPKDLSFSLHRRRKKRFLEIAELEGFHPIETGEKPVAAGEGGFGAVLRGIYQGKPAVAKIILGSEGGKEADNWGTIQYAANTTVPEIKKHLPNIYKINSQFEEEAEDDDWDYDGQNYTIIIMEELFPVSEEMRLKIEANFPNLYIFENPEYLWEIATKFEQIVKGFISSYRKEISISAEDIFKWLMEYDFWSDKDEYIYNLVEKIIDKVLKNIYEKFPEFKTILEKEETEIVNKIIYLIAPRLPSSYQSRKDTTYYEFLPETQNFITSLIELANRTGLGWDDLFERNMMMDRDGNLKLIDVGIYYDIFEYKEFVQYGQ